ncbi:hypothetical protein HXX76_002487 [Chlamydomonas incerta]|uniref:Small RNA 2'-O-methyltransferase n=1 Tax=Chlamydomonas incerta TaxID=51695 RepID=A0A835TNS9_CHLIN|nr:hypothetical protein HXX76_002487 [Chlamydomonas incerta]|eukprot:KAG2442401.1 hypothetical protein HXX76_002487 [Chlamydomonas incerta]
MSQTQQNPKSLINQFYQRAKGPQPRYDAVPAPVDGCPQRFVCSVTLPGVTVEGETMLEQVFQEEGRSKKAAMDAAAATALAFLCGQPAYGATKPYEPSLVRTLAARVLSEQGLYRDPEVHGAAVAAAAYHDGWLPLSALVHSRLLRGWAREYGPGAGGGAATDPALLVDLMRRELAAQAATERPPGGAGGGGGGGLTALGLELAPSGLSVRLSAEAAAAALPGCLSEHMEAEVVAAGGAAGVVVIPADSSLPLREERLSVRRPLLDGVAQLLNCPSPAHVLQWGRVGHKATVARDPRGAAAGEAEAEAAEGTGRAEATGEGGEPAPMDEGSWRLAEAMSTAPGGLVGPQPQPQPQSGENETPAPATGTAGAAGAAADATAGAAGAGTSGAGHATAGGMRPPAPRRTTSVGSQQSMQLHQPPRHPQQKSAAAAEGGEEEGMAALSPEPSVSAPAAAAAPQAHRQQQARQQQPQGSASGAAQSAGGAGGGATTSAGGGAAAAVFGPPAVTAVAYRVDSTLTLAVHRGAAAMDWDAGGNEVRGPERSEVSPTTSTAHRQANAGHTSGGNAGADSATHTQQHHRGHHAHQHTQPPAPGPTSPLGSAPTSPRAEGGAGTGGGAAGVGGGSSVPAVLHPTSVTLPEPSLYSRLLLPPLPPPTPAAATDTAHADDAPLLYDPTAAAVITITGAELGPPATAATAGGGGLVLPCLAGHQLNVRATWLAGRPVYGDVVATTCRQSPTPHLRKNHHVMKWRSYGAAQWWATAAAAAPAAAYVRALHAPLLLRGLPHEFRGPSSWLGPLPRQLLDNYVAAHPPPHPHPAAVVAEAELTPGQYRAAVGATVQIDLEVPDVDMPGEGSAVVRGTNYLGLLYRVTAGPAPLDLVVQQAALAALHELQRLDVTCLTAGPRLAAAAAAAAPGQQGAPEVDEGDEAQSEGAEAEGLQVLEEGLAHARQPREGCMAKVAYSLYLTHSPLQQPHHTAAPEPAGPMGRAPAVAGGASAAALAAAAEAAGGADVASAGALDEQNHQQQDVAMAEAAAGGGGGGGSGAPSASGSPCGSAGGGSSSCVVLEQHAALTLYVGGGGRGAVPPQLDAALRRLRVGGRARLRLPVHLDGVNPFTQDRQPPGAAAAASAPVAAVCEVRLLHCSLPVVEGRGHVAGSGGGPALFSPPLGAQRMQAVAAALRREGAASLLDLGCGDAKLIEGLLLGRHGADAGGPLRRCVGVDISGGALAAGGRRLGRLTAAAAELETLPVNGEESVPVPVEVSLYRGSAMSPLLAVAAGGDGGGGGPQPPLLPPGLRGCDAAALVEVVEHLDPQPLALVGPAVLGGLRPRLLLVTTPNWEYNAVLRAAERLAAQRLAASRAAPTSGNGNGNGNGNESNGGAGGAGGACGGSGLAALPPASEWPGPPGRDGLPLRCADHRFEWTRAEFVSWASALAAEWGYDVSFEDIGAATHEQEAMQLLMEAEAEAGGDGDGGGGAAAASAGLLALPGSAPGGATQMAVFRLQQPSDAEGGEVESRGLAGPAVGATALGRGGGGVVQGGAAAADAVAAVIAASVGGPAGGDKEGGEGGGSGAGWELVWGPAKVAAPREELDEAEAAVEAGLGRRAGGATSGGGAGDIAGSGRRGQAPGKRRSSKAADGSGAELEGGEAAHGAQRPLQERADGGAGGGAAHKRPHLDPLPAADAQAGTVDGRGSDGGEAPAPGPQASADVGDVDVF